MNDADGTFLSNVPLVGKLLAMRDTLRAQSVAALVEQMIIELGLHQVVNVGALLLAAFLVDGDEL